MKATHVAALLAALAVACAVCDPADDLLKSVPRYKGPISFRQYAGYIPVDKTNGRYLYYWFAESQRNPSTDPVVRPSLSPSPPLLAGPHSPPFAGPVAERRPRML